MPVLYYLGLFLRAVCFLLSPTVSILAVKARHASTLLAIDDEEEVRWRTLILTSAMGVLLSVLRLSS